MLDLTDSQAAQYFRRCFTAVDGLWFMKTEERSDFDTALEVDCEVWSILPKIQARALQAIGGVGDGMHALRDCLETKLTLEGFGFTVEQDDAGAGFAVRITTCPWHEKMIAANRAHLSAAVGNAICSVEYRAFAAEFEATVSQSGDRICTGGCACFLRFTPGEGAPPA